MEGGRIVESLGWNYVVADLDWRSVERIVVQSRTALFEVSLQDSNWRAAKCQDWSWPEDMAVLAAVAQQAVPFVDGDDLWLEW